MLSTYQHLSLSLAALACHVSVAMSAGAGNVTMGVDGFAPAFVKEPAGRGTLTIVWSSVVTLFLSAWMTLHLNIPKHGETGLEMCRRWARWGFLSFIFPEFIVFVAFGQWQEARQFQRHLNQYYQRHQSESASQDQKLNHKKDPPFSRLYAWYAIMGGLSLKCRQGNARHDSIYDYWSNHGPMVLMAGSILKLASIGHFIPIEDASIKDKSKADYLAKILVCIQVLWFVCQVAQRKIAGLPISLLEFHVLVNIGCGLIIYALWFRKPRAIDTASEVDEIPTIGFLASLMLTKAPFKSKIAFQSNRLDSWEAKFWLCIEKDISHIDKYRGTDNKFVITIAHGGKRVIVYAAASKPCLLESLSRQYREQLRSEFARVLEMDFQQHAAASFETGYLTSQAPNGTDPLRSTTITVSPMVKSGSWPEPTFTEQNIDSQPRIFSIISISSNSFRKRVRNFENDVFFGREENLIFFGRLKLGLPGEFLRVVLFVIVFSAYGAIHLIADLIDFSFPSYVERLIWRTACYTIIGFAAGGSFLVIMSDFLLTTYRYRKSWPYLRVLFAFLITIYGIIVVAARSYLLVESFISLRKERVEIYQTPVWNWLDYIPHV